MVWLNASFNSVISGAVDRVVSRVRDAPEINCRHPLPPGAIGCLPQIVTWSSCPMVWRWGRFPSVE